MDLFENVRYENNYGREIYVAILCNFIDLARDTSRVAKKFHPYEFMTELKNLIYPMTITISF